MKIPVPCNTPVAALKKDGDRLLDDFSALEEQLQARRRATERRKVRAEDRAA